MKTLLPIILAALLTGCLEDNTPSGPNVGGLGDGLTLEDGTFTPNPTPSPSPTPSPTATPTPSPTPPTYDGVVFTTGEAAKALEIANLATDAQLTSGGVSTAAKNTILSGRPYADLASFSSTTGIGEATLSAIKTMTATWVPPSPSPTPTPTPAP
jgi:hypothetical protein